VPRCNCQYCECRLPTVNNELTCRDCQAFAHQG
jgi:hypothetical protein